MSKPDAIRLAKEAAMKDGINLSDYQRPEARYGADDRTWFVFFDGRGRIRAVGSHFGVYIDDQTGESRVIRGM